MKLRALAIVEIEVDDVNTKLCAHKCSWLRIHDTESAACTLYERRLQYYENRAWARRTECRERSSPMLNPGG